MNLTSLITVDYENIANWKLGENKPNTNPIYAIGIKPNLPEGKIDAKCVVTKDYNNEQRTMNNERSCKTKPKQTQPVVSLPAVSKVEPSNLFPKSQNEIKLLFDKGL